MLVQLESGAIQGPVPLVAPEQDYLSRFYMHKLSNIHVKWNYQLHQLCYCARPGNQDSVRMQLEYKDIKILHFSCALKPRELVLDSDMHAMSRSEFIEHKLSTVLHSTAICQGKATDCNCTEWLDSVGVT